jgi:hypothetical protein
VCPTSPSIIFWRVLERRAEKGKVKSHVDHLKNKNKRSSEEPERHDKTEKKDPQFPLTCFSPPLVFAKADEALACVEIGWRSALITS